MSRTNSALTSSNSRIEPKTYRLCLPNLVKKWQLWYLLERRESFTSRSAEVITGFPTFQINIIATYHSHHGIWAISIYTLSDLHICELGVFFLGNDLSKVEKNLRVQYFFKARKYFEWLKTLFFLFIYCCWIFCSMQLFTRPCKRGALLVEKNSKNNNNFHPIP